MSPDTVELPFCFVCGSDYLPPIAKPKQIRTTGHVIGVTGSLLGLVEDRLVALNGDMSMECAVRAIRPGLGGPLP